MAALSLLGSLAVVLVMVVALRSGGRGGLGAVMVLPVLLMALGRLAPTLTDRRRAGGRAGTGWQGREPDPPSLLLALAPRIGMTREYVRRNVGFPVRCDATRSRTELGVRYRPAQKSLEAMVEQMLPRRSPTA